MERLGAYDVIGRIGTGGSADLLLAARGRTRVVLKKLHPHLAEDEAYVRMFTAEARVMSILEHDNIVRASEVERDGGAVFFALELVDGPSLAAVERLLHARGDALPVDVAVAVAARTAAALAYAHAARDPGGAPLSLVHRDVAASNMLVSRDGDVKLTDFGVVKVPRSAFLSSASTSGGVLKGHLATMSPEQVRGAPVDARADLYSLGVVLWEAVEGRRMFSGTPLELVERIANEPAPALTRADAPPALAALLDALLRRAPAARPATAGEVQDALDGIGPASAGDIANLVRSLGVPSLRTP